MLLLPLAAIPGVSCGKGGGGGATGAAGGAGLPVISTKTGVQMVAVPGGWFQMGSPKSGFPREEGPAHRVWVSPFLMDRTEVTQEQFRRLSLPDPSHFKGPQRPVEHISFADAMEYCNERSAAEGLTLCYARKGGGGAWTCDFDADGYRLPTEAEWEYACRAGSTDACHFGPADERLLRQHAWFAGNSAKQTHPVGGLRPSPWGLYDMYGNVAEWCQDAYDPNYYASAPSRDPRGPAGPARRVVLRGGAWDCPAERCRSAARAGEDPRFQDVCFAKDTIGFRCVRRAPAGPPASGPATRPATRSAGASARPDEPRRGGEVAGGASPRNPERTE